MSSRTVLPALLVLTATLATGCDSASTPTAAGSPAPATTSPAASPAAPASPAATPSPSVPATTTSTAAPVSPSARTPRKAATDACPVSAAQLQRASVLPRDWRVDPATIKCAQWWASADQIPPAGKEGDGIELFEFDRKAGRWRSLTEGSAIRCKRYGIPQSAGDVVGCGDF